MSPLRLEVDEAHRVGGHWFVDLRVRGGPDRELVVEQAETGARVAIRTGSDGRAAARVRLPVVPSVPVAILRLLDGDDAAVAVVGAEHLPLSDVLRARDAPDPGTVVTAFGGAHTITHDLRLDRSHLYLGPGTSLRFARDAGLGVYGGAVRALGTADAPVVFEGATTTWTHVALIDGLVPSRFVHARFVGGRGSAPGEPYELLTGGETVGGGLAALHVCGLELEHVSFSGCAADLGGALYAEAVHLSWSDVRFLDNAAGRGGAVALQHARGCLRGLEMARNTASREGRSLYCSMSPDLRIEDSEIADDDVAVAPRGCRIELVRCVTA